MTTMPFGKFADRPLDKVPRRYLEWTLEKCSNLTDALREDIRCVLDGVPLPERPDDQFVTLEQQLAAAFGRR